MHKSNCRKQKKYYRMPMYFAKEEDELNQLLTDCIMPASTQPRQSSTREAVIRRLMEGL